MENNENIPAYARERHFRNISEIKEFNEAKGQYYFDKGAMRGFSSRPYNQVWLGHIFIDSTRMDARHPRLYKVLIIDGFNGHIYDWPGVPNLYDSKDYYNLKDAKKAAAAITPEELESLFKRHRE